MYTLKDGHDINGAEPAGGKRRKSGGSSKSLLNRLSKLEKSGKAEGNKPLAEGSTFQIPLSTGKGKGGKGSKGKGGKGKGSKGKGSQGIDNRRGKGR